jgi:hypothetical protein
VCFELLSHRTDSTWLGRIPENARAGSAMETVLAAQPETNADGQYQPTLFGPSLLMTTENLRLSVSRSALSSLTRS